MASERPATSPIRVRPGPGAPPPVDGHPGWVQQSVKTYIASTVATIFMQSFLASAGPAMERALSAAWLSLLAGALMAMLLWVPLYFVMRGAKPITLDEAFTEAFGKIISGILTAVYMLLLLYNTYLSLRAAASLVRQYLIANASEVTVFLILILGITLAVTRQGGKGMARLSWYLRRIFVLGVMLGIYIAYRNGNFSNLFPVLGAEIPMTLESLPISAGGFTGIILLGLLPRETGSTKPVRFSTGVKVLLIGTAGALVYVLATNLSMPPRAIPQHLLWGRQLMLAAEYLSGSLLRMLCLMFLMLLLLISSGVNLAGVGALGDGILKGKASTIVWGCGIILAVMAFFSDQNFTEFMIFLMRWRFPVAAAPLWVTFVALLIKRSGKAAKA